LSRNIEQRSGREKSAKPMLSDLRECVAGDTLVVLASGHRVPIRELAGTTPTVWSVDGDGRIVASRSDRVWRVGERPVLRVRMKSGREVRITGEHRLKTLDEWRKAADLRAGDRIALARLIPEPAAPQPAWPEARLGLLAHLIGDGSYVKHQPLRYTSGSEESMAFVAFSARREFGVEVNRHEGRGNWSQLVFSGNGNRWHPSGMNLWLRELGIYGQRSHEKHSPSCVFGLSNECLAVLLRHLWATDGSVSLRKKGQRGAARVYFATCSRRLAEDVAALLQRLGIVSRIKVLTSTGHRPLYNVDITGVEFQSRFLKVVGAFGPRLAPAQALAEELAEELAKTRGNPNVDTIPREVFSHVRTAMRRNGVSTRAMAAVRGTAYGGMAHFKFAPSRATLGEYAEILEDAELGKSAASDLFWDTVASIEPAGCEEVFDLTVPGNACWLADGVVSHNSGAIEQDADIVLFVHRERVETKKDEDGRVPDRALPIATEIIVGKNRNGPIGTADLYFMPDFTLFVDAMDEKR
ncbi:intein-containing replicative DNA helicase, partial [Candidatus Poribacteria bacterium]|nr:intein-containing replicative DNA helicase [Candidatus Poribacteria bacterium]